MTDRSDSARGHSEFRSSPLRAEPVDTSENPARPAGALMPMVSGSLVLKIVAAAMGLAVALSLAHVLGRSGYGTYAYVMAWADLLVILAVGGPEQLLVARIAAYQQQKAWNLVRGIWRWANRYAVVVSLVTATAAAGIITALHASGLAGRGPQLLPCLYVALVTVAIRGLMILRQSALQGFGRVLAGQFPSSLVLPSTLLVLIGGFIALQGGMVPVEAVTTHLLACSVALITAVALLAPSLPARHHPVAVEGDWLSASIPFLLISGMHIVNSRTDTVMLGLLRDVDSAGIYHVASRIAETAVFVLAAVNAVIAPRLSSLHAAGDQPRLQSVVTFGARMMLLGSLPFVAAFVIAGHWLLALFGPGFSNGYTALVLLGLGQLINAAAGPVALLLAMTGHQRQAAIGISIGAILNVILNAVLIPRWGITGAAVATMTSTVVWNLVLMRTAHRLLGVHSAAIGRRRTMTTQ